MTTRNRRRGSGQWIPGAVEAFKRAGVVWVIVGWLVLIPVAILKGAP